MRVIFSQSEDKKKKEKDDPNLIRSNETERVR